MAPFLAVLPEIIFGVSAASVVGAGIAELVSKPSAPADPSQATTNTQQAAATQAAAQAQATALTQRRGMASTILTSPMGVGSTPNTQRSTLGA